MKQMENYVKYPRWYSSVLMNNLHISAFLAHLSRELKWAFLINCSTSVNFNIFDVFSGTTWPISLKLGTKHPWIQFCLKEGHTFFQGEIIILSERRNFKIFSSRTTWPISTKHSTKHPWMKGIQFFFQLKGHTYFKREMIMEYWKFFDKIWKSSSPKTQSQFPSNLAQCILEWRGFAFKQIKTIWFSKGG